MKVMVIPIVISPLGTVTVVLALKLDDLEIRWRLETIQTTALLKSDRIQRRVLKRLAVTQAPMKNHSADKKKTLSNE